MLADIHFMLQQNRINHHHISLLKMDNEMSVCKTCLKQRRFYFIQSSRAHFQKDKGSFEAWDVEFQDKASFLLLL